MSKLTAFEIRCHLHVTAVTSHPFRGFKAKYLDTCLEHAFYQSNEGDPACLARFVFLCQNAGIVVEAVEGIGQVEDVLTDLVRRGLCKRFSCPVLRGAPGIYSAVSVSNAASNIFRSRCGSRITPRSSSSRRAFSDSAIQSRR